MQTANQIQVTQDFDYHQIPDYSVLQTTKKPASYGGEEWIDFATIKTVEDKQIAFVNVLHSATFRIVSQSGAEITHYVH
jgi:hypothetical protein